MIGTLHIDDLDGAVTLFKYTDEGTETIAVFGEEHREVIQDLLAEVKRLQKRNEWLEEVVALLQEDGVDLAFEGYPLWEGEEE